MNEIFPWVLKYISWRAKGCISLDFSTYFLCFWLVKHPNCVMPKIWYICLGSLGGRLVTTWWLSTKYVPLCIVVFTWVLLENSCNFKRGILWLITNQQSPCSPRVYQYLLKLVNIPISTKRTNILTRTSTSNTELQTLSCKTPACVTAYNWNCRSMFFAIFPPRSKSCQMESIQRVTEINRHILNQPSMMERIYIFLFKDNTKTNTKTDIDNENIHHIMSEPFVIECIWFFLWLLV